MWRAEFDEVFARIGGRFAQACLRKRAYLLGLLSRAERKNGWTLAELAGVRDSGRDAAAAELLFLVS